MQTVMNIHSLEPYQHTRSTLGIRFCGLGLCYDAPEAFIIEILLLLKFFSKRDFSMVALAGDINCKLIKN